MKRNLIYLILAFLACIQSVYAQISTNEHPVSIQKGINNLVKDKTKSTIDLPVPDIKKIIHDDSLFQEKNPYGFQRTSIPIPIEIDINRDGVWSTLEDGGKLWQMEVHAEKALALDFVFSKFWLPKDGKFFIFNPETKETIGAITSKYILGDKINPHKFSTGIVKGNRVILEYFQPSKEKELPIIKGERAYYSYVCPWCSSCSSEVNINCAEGSNWQLEKNAVALVYRRFNQGGGWCSGFLVNNTQNNKSPLFLTANHCLIYDMTNDGGYLEEKDANGDSDLSDWVFYWGYELPDCGGSTQPSYRTTTGAILRANNTNSDFALLQLQQDPSNISDFIPYYLGWDVSGSSGTGGVCIHHPNGDVKKISTYECTPQTVSFNNNFHYYYWGVQWVQTANGHGITEAGSSGSPLINSDHNVIGQLAGSHQLDCSNLSGTSKYGKLSISWTGLGTSYSYRRLHDWLDPIGTGQTTLSSLDPIYISEGSYVQGPTSYHVVNLPSGYSVTWSLGGYVAAFLNVQQNTPSSNQCTLTFRSGDHDSAGGQLIANIYKGSTLVRTISKTICVINNLHATYSQEACGYYGVSHPAIPTTQMNPDIFYFVHQGCTVTLTCSYFKYFNLSWGSGFQPTDYFFNTNTVTFVLPLGSGGIPCYLNLKDDTGQICFQLKFFSASGNGNLTSNNISIQQTDHLLNVSLVDVKSKKYLDSKNVDSMDNFNNLNWTLEVYNGVTTEKVYGQAITGSSYNIDVSSWKKGLYIIRVVIGDEILNKKITIK